MLKSRRTWGASAVLLVSAVVIPALLIFMMTVVGLELSVRDFRRVATFPIPVMLALAAQLVVLPVIAVLISKLLNADASLAGGLILVAASPIAAISNYYTMLARANIAMAVTLTGFSSIVALVATPLVAAVTFELLLGNESVIDVPLARAILQLLLGLVLPIGGGMLIRALAPRWTERHQLTLKQASLVALAALVVYILIDQAAVIAKDLWQWVAAALLFSLASLTAGYALASLWLRQLPDRAAATIGFGTRNLAVAIMIAATVLHRVDFVAFGAVFFVSQLAVVIPLLAWARRNVRSHAEVAPTGGLSHAE
jgi:BASS family bile acid:Na+ symporter